MVVADKKKFFSLIKEVVCFVLPQQQYWQYLFFYQG